MTPPGTRVFSLATRTIAAELEKNKSQIQVDVLDIERGTSVEKAAQNILERQPEVVGFSTYIWNYTKHFRIADELRRRDKNIYIIFGGPQMFYDQEDLRGLWSKHPAIDLIVQGEGEIVLSELLRTSRHAWPASGTVLQGKAISRLGSFAYPLYERFASPFLPSYLDIEISRGCPRRCAYCCIPRYGHRPRTRPLKHLERELRWGIAQKIPSFSYISAGISYRKQYLKSLLKIIHRCDPEKTFFHQGEIDYQKLGEEEIELLRGLNFAIGLGLQSTSLSSNRLMRRVFDKKRFEEGTKKLMALGLQPVVEIILGLPDDRREDFSRTLRYALELELPLVVFLFMVLPGTEFYLRRRELGISYHPDRAHRVLATNTMSPADIESCLDQVRACAGRPQKDGVWIMLISDRGAEYIVPKKKTAPKMESPAALDRSFVDYVRSHLPPDWRRFPLREESGYLVLELAACGERLRVGFSPAGCKPTCFVSDGVADISYLVEFNHPDPLVNPMVGQLFHQLLEAFGLEKSV